MTPFDIWSLCVYGLVVALLLAGVLAVSSLLGERHAEPATGELFESGIVTVGEARFLVPVKFYLVAMFFVIFDLEAVFLFAWAASVHITGWTGFWEAAIFVGVLLAVLAYLWRVGAIDWGPQGGRDVGASERAGG